MKYLLLFFLTLLVRPVFTQGNANYLIGTQQQLYSDILGEERSYWISLPQSYESDPFYIEKHYPVMVLLDGHRLFHITSGIVRQMSLATVEEIPEMIIVAVENTDRNRDMCPDFSADEALDGAHQFQRFLEEELLPAIDTRYRTTPFRILVGHSFGGLFAVNACLEQADFTAYLAIDPSLWWQEQGIQAKAMDILGNGDVQLAPLYVAQANMPFSPGLKGGRLGAAIQDFKSIVGQTQDCQFDFFPNEDHFSIPTISIFSGLRWVFRNYRYDLQAVKYATVDSLEHHQKRLNEMFGVALAPPGKVYNQVGRYLYFQEREQVAGKALLEFNAKHYPTSIPALLSLASIYEAEGQTVALIAQLERVLALEPDNNQIKERLVDLQGSQ